MLLTKPLKTKSSPLIKEAASIEPSHRSGGLLGAAVVDDVAAELDSVIGGISVYISVTFSTKEIYYNLF